MHVVFENGSLYNCTKWKPFLSCWSFFFCYMEDLTKLALEGNGAFRARHGADSIVFKAAISNDYQFLSNFYVLVPPMLAALHTSDARAFTSVEAYFQAAKAVHVGLVELAEDIRLAATPLDAKRLGGASGMAHYIELHYIDNTRVPEALARILHEAMDIGSERKRKKAIGTILVGALETFDARGVMKRAIELKFSRSRDTMLVNQLLATGQRVLGESRGRSESRWTINRAGDPGLLGTLLMEQRAALQSSPVPPPYSLVCDICNGSLANNADAGTCGTCLRGTYCSVQCFAQHGTCQ